MTGICKVCRQDFSWRPAEGQFRDETVTESHSMLKSIRAEGANISYMMHHGEGRL